MKLLLIIVNFILAGIAVWQLSGIRTLVKTKTYTVKKRTVIKETRPVVRVSRKTVPDPGISVDADCKTIIQTNVFDQDRCPNAGPGASNVRVQMTLVGVCVIGETAGAVILQKRQAGNNNFMPPPPMTGGGRRMGFMQRSGNRNNGNAPMPSGHPPMMPGMFNDRQESEKKMIGTFKQYIRVGETLANGYKLVSVTRTKAVLTRGSDRLELELQAASLNAPKGNVRSNAGNRNSGFSQSTVNRMMRSLQQIQRMQGFQNGQMMRMMQQNNDNRMGGMNQPAGRNRNNSRR